MDAALVTSVFLNNSKLAQDAEELDDVPLDSIPLYTIANRLFYICSPIIVLLGTFGNIMTIIIMLRMSSGEFTIKYYFIGMALMDLIVLFSASFIEWIRVTFGLDFKAMNSAFCKILIWYATGSGTVSCWYLVCLTLHRALFVVWPHRINTFCTRRTVQCTVAGITLFFAALYAHYLFGFDLVLSDDSSKYECLVESEDYSRFVVDVFVYIEMTIYSLLPFICLVLGNCVLIWRLSVSVREARTKLSQGNSEHILAREKTANSVTLTVTVLSVTFIILTMPVCIYYILTFFGQAYHEVTSYEYAKVNMFYTISFLLADCNSALNFYMYCLTGRKFREKFIKLFHCQTISQ